MPRPSSTGEKKTATLCLQTTRGQQQHLNPSSHLPAGTNKAGDKTQPCGSRPVRKCNNVTGGVLFLPSPRLVPGLGHQLTGTASQPSPAFGGTKPR